MKIVTQLSDRNYSPGGSTITVKTYKPDMHVKDGAFQPWDRRHLPAKVVMGSHGI